MLLEWPASQGKPPAPLLKVPPPLFRLSLLFICNQYCISTGPSSCKPVRKRADWLAAGCIWHGAATCEGAELQYRVRKNGAWACKGLEHQSGGGAAHARALVQRPARGPRVAGEFCSRAQLQMHVSSEQTCAAKDNRDGAENGLYAHPNGTISTASAHQQPKVLLCSSAFICVCFYQSLALNDLWPSCSHGAAWHKDGIQKGRPSTRRCRVAPLTLSSKRC